MTEHAVANTRYPADPGAKEMQWDAPTGNGDVSRTQDTVFAGG